MNALEGRVAIITGAGRGIGREHALLFASEGAKVVVNDLGGSPEGTGSDATPAEEVVAEIHAMGGEAIANHDDVTDFEAAKRLVDTTVETFGELHVLVNNAGILRDRTMVNMAEDEWDSVIKVHLKGTFASSHFAAVHWRERSKAGDELDARIINTTSASGLYGSPGQANYGAAKAGIAAFTVITAQELSRYGVRVNAVSPGARTRMTEALGYGSNVKEGSFDFADPENVAPIVAWLASPEAADVTGQVFEAHGGIIGVEHGWRHGPRVKQAARWDPAELGPVVRGLLAPEGEPAQATR